MHSHVCCEQCRTIEPVANDYEMTNWGLSAASQQTARGYPTCILNGVCTNGLTWARNDGSGVFGAATVIGEGGSGMVIAQDLDRDGDIDILAGAISPPSAAFSQLPKPSRIATCCRVRYNQALC